MTIGQRIEFAKAQTLLTVAQFALLTQYQQKSIYKMVGRGDLPFVRIGKRGIRIPRSIAAQIRRKHPHADQLLAL